MSRFAQNCERTHASDVCLSTSKRNATKIAKAARIKRTRVTETRVLKKRISINLLLSQTLGDMMSYSNGAGRANAKAAYSVASSGDIEVGFFPLIGHDSLLLVLSQFLLFLFGIYELVPGDATRIKPL
jgi:hypothetical protein